MHVGKNNPCNKYYLGDTLLPAVTSEKDLGVLHNNSLTWDDQITNCVKKANSIIAWICRTVISRSVEVMLPLYITFVRPHLEYCVHVWSPLPSHGNWGLILQVEDVQRSYTRMINDIGTLTYEDRLTTLSLTTLLERRARGDLIETFKIISGIAKYGHNLFNLSRRSQKLVSRPGDQNRFKHSLLSRRVTSYWNRLPLQVRSVATVDSFKNALSKFKTNNYSAPGQYWELSSEIFNRIDNRNHCQYVTFLENNPQVAKARKVNIF
jgi:hypothetical protein